MWYVVLIGAVGGVLWLHLQTATGTEMNTLTARFQVLAVNDAADFCECCGRKGLKKVVWVLDNETGDHKHFGTSCVLAPNKAFGLDKQVAASAREFSVSQAAARKAAWLNANKYNKVTA